MTIEQLDNKKRALLHIVSALTIRKEELSAAADIASPMSDEEKKLTRRVADIYSEINLIVRQKRALRTA